MEKERTTKMNQSDKQIKNKSQEENVCFVLLKKRVDENIP